MNICASQSSSFNTNREDIGVLFPAPLHWATAPSPSCCECRLMVLSFSLENCPLPRGTVLPGKSPSLQKATQPKANGWLWLTLVPSSRRKQIYDAVYNNSECCVHPTRARLPGTTLLLSSLFFHILLYSLPYSLPVGTLTINQMHSNLCLKLCF